MLSYDLGSLLFSEIGFLRNCTIVQLLFKLKVFFVVTFEIIYFQRTQWILEFCQFLKSYFPELWLKICNIVRSIPSSIKLQFALYNNFILQKWFLFIVILVFIERSSFLNICPFLGFCFHCTVSQ